MSQQILEKRTHDSRTYDIDCSLLLDAAEVITTVTSVADDSSELTFGTAIVNVSPVVYPGPRTVAAGKVVQVRIGGGVIPDGYRAVIRTVRVRLVTSLNPQIEATVLLKLQDQIP